MDHPIRTLLYELFVEPFLRLWPQTLRRKPNAPPAKEHGGKPVRPQMPDIIKSGTILIKMGTTFPDGLHVESETCAPGWRFVTNLDGYGLDRKVLDAGWTSFRLAGEIKATAFGFDGQNNVRRAVQRILSSPRSRRSNSLEITRVASTRSWGLPYVTISAHSRHFQKGPFLFPETERQEWRQTGLAAATTKG